MIRTFLKPYGAIFRLAWPLAIGMVNNALMQFTDRAFLARESMESLEAVLAASMLAYVVLGFFQSVVAYSGTFVAQYFGAGDLGRCRQSYHAGLLIAVVSGILVFAAIPLGDWVFATFSNGEEIIAKQRTYYRICISGGVFLFGQMAVQAFFTGLGKTRIVLWANILGNVLNVVLDPIMIFGWLGCPKLGIAGAAYATVIATAVQWVVLAVVARRQTRTMPKVTAPILPLVRRVLRFGIPSGAYSVLNCLSFTIFVFFTGTVGHVDAAVSNAAFSVCYLLFAPMEGFALGATTLVGHDCGRGDHDAAMRTGFRVVALGCAFEAAVSILVVVFRHPILAIYAPADPAVALQFHELGSVLFVLMAIWEIFDAADVILSGALKGVGDTRFVMLWMLIVAFLVWLPMVWIVHVTHNTMTWLWGTTIIYMVIICAGSIWRWRRGKWKNIRLVAG